MDKKRPEQRHKLELFFSAKKLKNTGTFSKTDPRCKIFYLVQGEAEVFLGSTETVKGSLNPVWETTFTIDYIFELTQTLRVEIWDSDDSCVGLGSITIADVIGSKNSEAELHVTLKKKEETGIVKIKIDKQIDPDTYVSWTWSGSNLINTDGMFGLSDPFLKFYKECGVGEWFQVHKTEFIKNNLNPNWMSFEISTVRLCNGNSDQRFKVECWDLHHKGADNQYMGFFITSLHEIFTDGKVEFNLELPKNSSGGLIILKEKKQIFRPTFYDYLKDGQQINLIIGIDYTIQNGEFTFPDSLHVQKSDNTLNAYQTAIKHCGQILLSYDSDKKVPVYGFGAIPHLPNYNVSDTEHCFPLSGDFSKPEVIGIQNVMELYKSSIQHLQLSGPCQISQLITYCKEIAEQSEKKNIYTVLLLLTCGQIHDLQDTVEILAECNKVPLSIVLVGMGEFDFKKIEHLDSEQQGSTQPGQARNIVQFVEYQKFGHSLPLLQREVLAQLPHQLVDYMTLAGKVPKDHPIIQ